MRVLVTGGTGFVGTHTVAALLDAGHDVKLLVRSPERVGPSIVQRIHVRLRPVRPLELVDLGTHRVKKPRPSRATDPIGAIKTER